MGGSGEEESVGVGGMLQEFIRRGRIVFVIVLGIVLWIVLVFEIVLEIVLGIVLGWIPVFSWPSNELEAGKELLDWVPTQADNV